MLGENSGILYRLVSWREILGTDKVKEELVGLGLATMRISSGYLCSMG